MGFVVGVAGAPGALGQEIIRALADASWGVDELVPLARSASKTPFIDFKDAEVAVDDIQDEVLERLDLLLLALPAEAAITWGERAIHEGVPVVDASGALQGQNVPVGVPWINPDVLSETMRGAVCLPAPETLLAASVLAPLFRAGLDGDVEVTFFVPASRSGRAGIEELSRQVVTMFNAGTPPRKVFPGGLAFDLLPSAGEAPGTGETATELRVRSELQALLGAKVHVTRVTVPVFSGLSMELRIEPNKRPMPELVRQILTDGGVKIADDDSARNIPRPRRVEGQPFTHAGRIRIDEGGEVLRIWASMDNLRASAAVAVGLGGLLLRDRT